MMELNPYDTAVPRRKKGEALSQEELIKSEIERLHKKGGADWESLDAQVRANPKRIEFNRLQVMIDAVADVQGEAGKKLDPIIPGFQTYVEAGAGAGKSTAMGRRIQRLVMEMPRGSFMLVGETYQQILTRTLPTTIHGLEALGIYQNLHYFVGRKPPSSWKFPMAYKPPMKADKAIFFWTGAVINLVSQDVQGDGKSLNSDALLADEATQLNKKTLDIDQRPRVRGSEYKEFEKQKLFLSELYLSTTAITEEGFWYEEMEEKIKENRLELERKLKTYRYSEADRLELERQMLEQVFLKATWKVNAKNLPPNYLDKAKQSALDAMQFNAEYLGIRPQRVKGGFYSLFSQERHCYTDFDYSYYVEVGAKPDCRGDRDLTRGVPLILGIDWGGVINCLTVNQNLQSINEYRTLKSMYVLGDEQMIQDDLFIMFDSYYAHHKESNKQLFLYYDNQGNQGTGISKQTRAEKAAAQLRTLGWQPRLMTIGGRNERHDMTHLTWTYLLKGGHPRLPTYRMNKANCKELSISMRNAKTKPGPNGGIKKDKASEGSDVIARQHATDLSDANDKPIIGLFSSIVAGSGGGSSVGLRM